MNDVRRLQVAETFEGKTVWEVEVEVFSVRGHPQATSAFAWTYTDDDGKELHVAVLGVPPVDSPQNAVKAAVVAHTKRAGLPAVPDHIQAHRHSSQHRKKYWRAINVDASTAVRSTHHPKLRNGQTNRVASGKQRSAPSVALTR
jgi:hypothetical protein